MNPHDNMTPEEELREQGLQLVTRLVAVLRTSRSYSIGNRAFTGQLEQLLEVLRPTLMASGRAQLVHMDRDLQLNGVRVPLKSTSLRFQEQLLSELALRGIAGVEFHASLRLPELEEFMRYFLSSELYKGDELVAACRSAGITGAVPVLQVVPASAEATPPSEANAVPAFSAALQAYDDALAHARALLTATRFARGIELRHLKRLVQPLVEAAASPEPTTVGLAWASAADEQWAHGVHVCIVSIGMGHQLGLDRAALTELGVAALLHDVGQSSLETVPPDAAVRDDAARAELQTHPIRGVEAIAGITTLNRTSLRAMRVALEHHACTRSGYPALSADFKPATASRLVAVADAFVSLLSLHGERGQRITPAEALSMVLGPGGAGFDDALKASLIRTVGVYPPGQLVELDDHAFARALAPSAEDPERPIIELLTTPAGAILPASERVVMPLAEARSILRALPLDEWPDFSADSAAA